jgi:hypothetical protein
MKGRSVAVGAAAVLALAAGVAYGSIPDGEGVIHGCYKTNKGDLRVIDTGCCATARPRSHGARPARRDPRDRRAHRVSRARRDPPDHPVSRRPERLCTALELVAVSVELVLRRAALREEAAHQDEPAHVKQEVVDLGAQECGFGRGHAASSRVATATLPSGSTSASRGRDSTKSPATSAPSTASPVST